MEKDLNITIENASKEDVATFDEFFWKNKEARDILHRIDYYQKTNKYIQQFQERQKLDAIRKESFKLFMKEYKQKSRSVNLNDVKMTDGQREKINALYIAIYMACDIIESCVIDINDSLKRVGETLSMHQFDELKSLTVKVREKMDYFSRTEDFTGTDSWGDLCDEMYEMIQEKAVSLMKKKGGAE